MEPRKLSARVIRVKPNVLGGAGGSIQLVGNRRVSDGGVQVILIVLCGDSNIQGVIRARGIVVIIDIIAQNVAGAIGSADTGINVNTIQRVADHAEGQIGLNVSVLADGSAVSFCDGGNGVSVGVITEGGNFVRLDQALNMDMPMPSLLETTTSMASPNVADQVPIALPAVAASQVAPAEFFISWEASSRMTYVLPLTPRWNHPERR